MAKVAIVTGGARGIGRSCALALAERGYDVALVDLRVPEMQRTAAEIEDRGRSALQFEADVSSFDAAHQATDEIVAKWGRIDFLLNNAAIAAPQGLLDITEAEWDRTIDVNLKSCFVWSRHVVPTMLAAGEGRIVSMSSVNAFTGGVTAAVSKFAYAAAKAGILGLTRSLAKELGPAITVNAICPGVIKTEEGNTLVNARETELAKGNALKRLGTPRDIAELVAFLATVNPTFISGQAITADGFQWNA